MCSAMCSVYVDNVAFANFQCNAIFCISEGNSIAGGYNSKALQQRKAHEDKCIDVNVDKCTDVQ